MVPVCFLSIIWTTVVLGQGPSTLRRPPEACLLPPPDEDCGDVQLKRWFFDEDAGSCRQFLYQGCPDAGNHFETQEECQTVCADVTGIIISPELRDVLQTTALENTTEKKDLQDALNGPEESPSEITQWTSRTTPSQKKKLSEVDEKQTMPTRKLMMSPSAVPQNEQLLLLLEAQKSGPEFEITEEALEASTLTPESVKTSMISEVSNPSDSKSSEMNGNGLISASGTNGNTRKNLEELRSEEKEKQLDKAKQLEGAKTADGVSDGKGKSIGNTKVPVFQGQNSAIRPDDNTTSDQEEGQTGPTPRYPTKNEEEFKSKVTLLQGKGKAGKTRAEQGQLSTLFTSNETMDMVRSSEKRTGRTRNMFDSDIATTISQVILPADAQTLTPRGTSFIKPSPDKTKSLRSSETKKETFTQIKALNENSVQQELQAKDRQTFGLEGTRKISLETSPPTGSMEHLRSDQTPPQTLPHNSRNSQPVVNRRSPAFRESEVTEKDEGQGTIGDDDGQARPRILLHPFSGLVNSQQVYIRPAFCSLHRLRGHCSEEQVRWYYDPFDGFCHQFIYTGCAGNFNNFKHPEECTLTCTGKVTEGARENQRNAHGIQENLGNRLILRPFAELDFLPKSGSEVGLQRQAVRFFLDGLKRKFLPPPFAFPQFPKNIGEQILLLSDQNDAENPAVKEFEIFNASKKPPRRLGQANENQFKENQYEGPSRKTRKVQRFHGVMPDFWKGREEQVTKTSSDSQEPLKEYLRQLTRHSSPATKKQEFHRPTGTKISHTSTDGELSDSMKTHLIKSSRSDETNKFQTGKRFQRTAQRSTAESRQLPIPAPEFQANGQAYPKNVKNYRWIQQEIFLSNLPPARSDLPHSPNRRMERNRSPKAGWNWRGVPKQNDGISSPTAVVLRKNSLIVEAHARRKGQSQPMLRFSAEAFPLPRPMKPIPDEPLTDQMSPNEMALSLEIPQRGQPPMPSVGKVYAENPLQGYLPRLPAEESATSIGERETKRREMELGKRSSLNTDLLHWSTGKSDPRVPGGRFKDPENAWQEQSRGRSLPQERENYGLSSPHRRLPQDRFTFLQIFVNRDHSPYFQPRLSQYNAENYPLTLSLPRPQFDVPSEGSENGKYFLPRPQAPRSRSSDSMPDLTTGDNDWTLTSSHQPYAVRSSEELGSRLALIEHSEASSVGSEQPAVCQLPPDSGFCNYQQPKWFFNRENGLCTFFYYGGCAGNGNRFESEEECLRNCKEESDGPDLKSNNSTQPERSNINQKEEEEEEEEEEEKESSTGSVVIFTNPVYSGNDYTNQGSFEDKDTQRDEVRVVRPLSVTLPPLSARDGEKRGKTGGTAVLVEHSRTTETKETGRANAKNTEEKGGRVVAGESDGKEVGEDKDEKTKTFSTPYIAIVTAIGVVGLAIVLMVIVSIVRSCRKTRKSKREHSIQDVIKTHMYGDLPRGLYSESPSASSSTSKAMEKEEKLESK